MTLLIAHLLMASTHILWLLYDGRTSGCWTYVSELLVLAYNSNSSTASSKSNLFEGTGAGIHCGSTFGRMGKVIVRPGPGEEHEHVELVFDEDGEDETRAESPSNYDDTTALVGRKQDPPLQHQDLMHGGTWPLTTFDARASVTSVDTLVWKPTKDHARMSRRVQIGRAYG